MSTTCDVCGKRIPSGALFCPACGDPVTDADRGATAVSAQQQSVQLLCPVCGAQALYTVPPDGAARVSCARCGNGFDTRVMRVQSKRSAGNKRMNTRRFTVRVRDLVGRDDLVEFERPLDDDFDMRSRDLVAFTWAGGVLTLVQNLTLGRYITLVRPPPPPAQSMAGCGYGCIAAVVGLMLMLGFCSALTSGDRDARRSSPSSSYSSVGSGALPPPRTPEDLYLHGPLNIRSGPSETARIVGRLRRGDTIRVGEMDGTGWAPLYGEGGVRRGFVYRASNNIRTTPPSSGEGRRTTSSSRRSSAADRGYHRGPRGGCYTYTSGDKRRYVDRSLCN